MLAIRTARWSPTHSDGLAHVEWEKEVEHSVRIAKIVLSHLTARSPELFQTKDVPTAVSHPGNFYRASLEATLRLGKRAVLIGARDLQMHSDQVLAVPYAPYAAIFLRASVIVHQGGSGTTAQALRAGRPMLFVPFGWDQPDNAARVERLGAGLSIPRKQYSAATASTALHRLFSEPGFASRTAELGEALKLQHGVQEACDAVETAMRMSG